MRIISDHSPEFSAVVITMARYGRCSPVGQRWRYRYHRQQLAYDNLRAKRFCLRWMARSAM